MNAADDRDMASDEERRLEADWPAYQRDVLPGLIRLVLWRSTSPTSPLTIVCHRTVHKSQVTEDAARRFAAAQQRHAAGLRATNTMDMIRAGRASAQTARGAVPTTAQNTSRKILGKRHAVYLASLRV